MYRTRSRDHRSPAAQAQASEVTRLLESRRTERLTISELRLCPRRWDGASTVNMLGTDRRIVPGSNTGTR